MLRFLFAGLEQLTGRLNRAITKSGEFTATGQ